MPSGSETTTNRTPASQSVLQSAPASTMGPRLLVILSAAALLVVGLVMVFSTSSITGFSEQGDAFSETIKQCIFAAAGILLCLFCVRFISMDFLRTWAAEIFWGITMVLLIATAAFGTVGLGAKRWLYIGSFGIQPSEFAKITITIMAAKLAMQYNEGQVSAGYALIGGAITVVAPLFIMLVFQSDLGTTAICIVAVLAVLVLCGVPWRAIIVLCLVIGALGVAAIMAASYRTSRLNFLDPWADAQGSGLQLVHSFLALASGGVLGVGLGNSFEKMLYLPEAETDFIFSIIGEEGGLIATLLVVACFVVFLYGGFRIALNSRDSMGTYLAGALSTMLVFQAFLNIMCAIGFAPTTGKPLPFVSSGGSSLVSSLIIVGLILSVSMHDSGDEHARRRGDLRILSAQGAGAGMQPRRGAVMREDDTPRRGTGRTSNAGSDAYGGFRPASNAGGYGLRDSADEDAYVNRNRGYSSGYSNPRSAGARTTRSARGNQSRGRR